MITNKQHQDLILRYEKLKRVIVEKDKELIKLRKTARVQHLEDHKDTSDLMTNIRHYLESEYLIDLSLKTRLRPYIKARSMFFWFGKRYTNYTLRELASYLNQTDHSVVIHSLNVAENFIEQDREYSKALKKYDEYILENFINPKPKESIEYYKKEIERLNLLLLEYA